MSTTELIYRRGIDSDGFHTLECSGEEIVRCRDCIHRNIFLYTETGLFWCSKSMGYHRLNGFCDEGSRKPAVRQSSNEDSTVVTYQLADSDPVKGLLKDFMREMTCRDMCYLGEVEYYKLTKYAQKIREAVTLS